MCVIMSMSVSTATIRSGMIDPPVTTFNINLTLGNLQTKNISCWSVCHRLCFCIYYSFTMWVSKKELDVIMSGSLFLARVGAQGETMSVCVVM